MSNQNDSLARNAQCLSIKRSIEMQKFSYDIIPCIMKQRVMHVKLILFIILILWFWIDF